MHFLLDTNICIYLIKKHPRQVLKRFRQHSPQDVAISTITLFELQYGVEQSQYPQRSKDALAKFLLPLNLIKLDRSSAIEAAIIRAQLKKKGMPIGPYDLLIAGLARSRDMTLVTNNIKEFKRIVSLRLENWMV
ncbi:MAG: type II toxin-antitoxin system VapC family toxin [Deltaproteobacteria bacterium]|nr:type II toxin-antitoxin system VapC family toxin [Deltaproteobacteria bacterium]MBW2319175.1 type II toxin-antitoxin system VapC family toxin [Deltaproteobacteria bacterium]